ncbi:GNAT family N-acetyltransferase [Paenibacillus ehimensis]|uniref:GNAT family N-acetyltransferase n=1 Tax=Paenibacillus ehimensis TaxID=79264 RepID=A0ABT8V3D8_9BACL|nr:GNAT family N-acetyltransferase [Paenibacillus ehimensis]MDO3675946.1 GNAT family N-acetyltransferase [Paenibacillus ehimensis]
MNPSHSLTVCQAGHGDIEALMPLFDAYRQFYRQPSDLERAERFLRDNLERQQSVIFFAYTGDRSRPIGFTQLYPTLSSIATKRVWTLNDLFVHPDARKQGVGQALMKAAEAHARATQAKGLQLSTAVDNVTAQRLYEAMGYVRDDAFLHYYLRLED